MSLFRAAAYRQHPMFKIGLSDMLIGLPTGIAMFATVKAAEMTGLLTYPESEHTTHTTTQ